jgi:hypothetical protein
MKANDKHMLECEARYWIAEGFKLIHSGQHEYQVEQWWEERKISIRRKRGNEALAELLAEMGKQVERQ